MSRAASGQWLADRGLPVSYTDLERDKITVV